MYLVASAYVSCDVGPTYMQRKENSTGNRRQAGKKVQRCKAYRGVAQLATAAILRRDCQLEEANIQQGYNNNMHDAHAHNAKRERALM